VKSVPPNNSHKGIFLNCWSSNFTAR